MTKPIKITIISLITIALIGGGVYGGYRYSHNSSNNNAIISQEKEISFSTFDKGVDSNIKKKKNYVIKDQQSWDNLINTAFEYSQKADFQTNLNKEIDFDKYMLIAVFQGEQPSSGYNTKISKIVEKPSSIAVTYQETSPSNSVDQAVLAVLTQPYHIIRLEKTDKTVDFIYELDKTSLLDTNNWKTYPKNNNGLSFEYPGDWFIQETSNSNVSEIAVKPINLDIFNEELDQDIDTLINNYCLISIDNIITPSEKEKSLKELAKSWRGSEGVETQIDGRKAVMVFNDNEISIFTADDNDLKYLIQIESKHMNNYSAIFDTIIANLKFNK